MSHSLFADALAAALRSDPARPLVTFYDDATGERVELSVTTYANWVAKTAGLGQDELDLERGARVHLDLPTHWLGPVWLGAAWTAGWCVTTAPDLADEADLVVCGPDGVERYAAAAASRPVVALSLRPLGGRFTEPLPTGVVDYGAVVLAQPDAFVSYDPPAAGDAAWSEDGRTESQADVLGAVEPLVAAGDRLLTDRNPCTRSGRDTLLAPLLHGGGAVWVAHPDAAGWDRRAEAERAGVVLREEQ